MKAKYHIVYANSYDIGKTTALEGIRAFFGFHF